jgi:predicted ester cyclase
MSTESNKAIVRRFVENIQKKNLNAAFADYSPQFKDHEVPPGTPSDLEATKQFFTMVIAAFPDQEATLEDIVAEGDRVVTRLKIRGTHQGSFMGVPPTGKSLTFEVIDIIRIVDNKVVEHWGLTDQVGMMQQMGVLPPVPQR